MINLPSIAHLFLGAVVGISLFYISDGKFSKTHALILMLNNYFGPDAGYVVGLGNYTHSYLFWPLFAMLLTFFYHYFTKFTIKIDKIREIELIELKDYKLTFLNTYFVVIAGGFMHCYLDGMMNWKGVFMLSPEIGGTPAFHPTLDDVFHLWWDGLLEVNPILAFTVGIMFIFGFVFVIVWFLKKNTFRAGMVVVIYMVSFLVFFALAGNMTTMNHPDGGAVVYVSLFWALPLTFIVLSTREFEFLKREKNIIKRKESSLNCIKSFYFILGLLTIIEGLALFTFQDLIITKLTEYLPVLSNYRGQFLIAFTVVSILLIGIGVFIIILWFKLRQMENHNRNLLFISVIFLIAGTAMICVSILGFLLGDAIIPVIYAIYEDQISEYLVLQDVMTLAFVIEIVTLVFTIVFFVSALGLTMKNRKIWRFNIYYNLAFAWTILGLVVACNLSEDSVKKIMKSREI